MSHSPGFIQNRGQWPDTVRYRYTGRSVAAWVHDDGLTLRLKERPEPNLERGVVLRWTFVGAAPTDGTRGRDRLPGDHNFMIGRDRSRWAVGVPSFARTVAADAYPGIDVVWQWRNGRLAYDLHVAPGADPTQVVTRIDGAEALRVDAEGNLIITTDEGEVKMTAPVSWERDGRRRRPVDSRFVIDGADSYRIAVDRVDADAPLVIDPGLEWAARYGSGGDDQVRAADADDADNLYCAGWTDSASFPTSTGAFQVSASFDDEGFITCLNPRNVGAAQLVWSTYYGGDGPDLCYDIDVNPAGTRVTVVGTTRSTDLPAQNSMQPENGGGWDGFVAQLVNNGRGLRYSTYVGGIRNDRGLALDRLDNNTLVVAGTAGDEFPVLPVGFQTRPGGNDDAYVLVLRTNVAPASQMIASTLFGGAGTESMAIILAREDWDTMDVSVTPNGDILLGGSTRSGNLPVTPGAFQPELGAPNREDAFIALFNPSLTTLRYGSYLGADNNDWFGQLRMSPAGEIYGAGTTFSQEWPLSSNPIDDSYGGDRDGFAVRINPAGQGASDLVYSTYIGDSTRDQFFGLSLESSGIMVIAGVSPGGIPPTPGSFRTTLNGGAVLLRVDPANNGPQDLHYAAVLGDNADVAMAVVPTSDGAYFIAGNTAATTTFPVTPGALSTTGGAGIELFAARIDTLPSNMTRLTQSTPACDGYIDLQVNRMLAPGANPFELIVNNTPPFSQLALVLLGFPLNGSFVFLTPNMLIQGQPSTGGAAVFMLPNAWQFSGMSGSLMAPVFMPDNGFMRVTIPVPPNLPSGKANLSFQAVFLGTPGCGGDDKLFGSDRISF